MGILDRIQRQFPTLKLVRKHDSLFGELVLRAGKCNIEMWEDKAACVVCCRLTFLGLGSQFTSETPYHYMPAYVGVLEYHLKYLLRAAIEFPPLVEEPKDAT
ncbi:hypothetical protein LPP1_g13 [Leptolyngbya phage LPP-1]|uniref:Uncharacterized protein n=1 Tax=Leptolyngbya phage LPP-1 TaxID=2996049 RepID=A0AAE9PS81_9CAUD|nr:hypothetical protein LPP1_g13 [Leptolyngbya phage LPP-1]